MAEEADNAVVVVGTGGPDSGVVVGADGSENGIAALRWAADAAAAKALLAVGEAKSEVPSNPAELAAFTSVASTLLNLDEAFTKE